MKILSLGKMKNREEWKQTVLEAKAHPELQSRGEGRKEEPVSPLVRRLSDSYGIYLPYIRNYKKIA
jgi:hypothetical protein